jgi:hypothetical protein
MRQSGTTRKKEGGAYVHSGQQNRFLKMNKYSLFYLQDNQVFLYALDAAQNALRQRPGCGSEEATWQQKRKNPT